MSNRDIHQPPSPGERSGSVPDTPPPGERSFLRSLQGPELSVRGAALVLALFLAGVVLWSLGARQVEELLGAVATLPRSPSPGPSGIDAAWHIATAVLLALPTRNRIAIILAPSLALGLDVDHVFGTFLPTVVMRQAHAFGFILVIAAALYLLHGRPAALLSAGAVFAHIGVDGGRFPFWAPASAGLTPLSFPEQVAFLAVSAVLFFLSVRTIGELRRLRGWAPVAGVVLALGGVIFVIWPYIQPYAAG